MTAMMFMNVDRPTADSLPVPACILLTGGRIAADSGLAAELSFSGHEVLTAAGPDEALALLQRRRIHCVVVEMAGAGSELAATVASLLRADPMTAVVLAGAGLADRNLVAAFRAGASDCWSPADGSAALREVIAGALQRREERISTAETYQWLQREVVQRSMELDRERERLERLSVATLEALVNALEAKDPYLRGHSARIADLAAAVAAEMRLSDTQVEMVRIAGRLHDIGKIAIHDAIMTKQGPLTEDEFAEVKAHPHVGSMILAPLSHLHDVIACVRSHHERFDGTGYPDGLAGTGIPIGARIIGAAEVYDALTTSRPYQERMEPAEAVSRMRDLVGTVLDPKVHEALSEVIVRRKALVFIDEG